MPKVIQRVKPKQDYGRILMWAAAIVSAPRYASLFLSADNFKNQAVNDAVDFITGLSGLAMGILIVIAVAYILDAIGRAKPMTQRIVSRDGRKVIRNEINFRWWGSLVFAAGILFLEPIMLAPNLLAKMDSRTISAVLNTDTIKTLWAFSMITAPAFVVGGVAFAQKNLVRVEGVEGNVDQPVEVNSGGGGQPLSQPAPNATQLFTKYFRDGMGVSELVRLVHEKEKVMINKGTVSKLIAKRKGGVT